MRKRVSRPRQFAAIDNKAIDSLPSILGIGLLTRLIRAKDGDDVTVETLASSYEEGEKSLTKAMRSLVDGAYVVKFKIQRATTETVIEDGKEVEKRGGSWFTTFTVDSIPFTCEDIAAMVKEIYAEGNVKSHRVEPTRLDPRNAPGEPARRPAPPGGGVGATRGNVGGQGAGDPGSGSRPTPPSGAPGRPTPGQGGAHIRNKTFSPDTEVLEDESEALSGRSPVDGAAFKAEVVGAEAEGDSVASSTTSPSDLPHQTTSGPNAGGKSGSKKAKHTRQQLELVAAVRAQFPAAFLAVLPDVPTLTQAILDALAGDVPAADRTVAQLGARIGQRWNHHGWAVKFYAGEILKPVGAAVAMVRPLKGSDRYGCANPRCEAGFSVDTGAECTVCPERIAGRQAERRQGNAQAAAGGSNAGAVEGGSVPSPRATLVIDSTAAFRECECRNLILPKGSTDTMCQECRRDADRVAGHASGPPF